VLLAAYQASEAYSLKIFFQNTAVRNNFCMDMHSFRADGFYGDSSSMASSAAPMFCAYIRAGIQIFF